MLGFFVGAQLALVAVKLLGTQLSWTSTLSPVLFVGGIFVAVVLLFAVMELVRQLWRWLLDRLAGGGPWPSGSDVWR